MTENTEKQEMVRVRVKEGRSYCEDEVARTKIHVHPEVIDIPRSRVNHTVEVLTSPTIDAAPEKPADEPEKGKPQHRMIESPRGGGRKS